ncbi:MAG TPA: 4-hydroxy-tetrahydrodipicolinate reductase [Bacillota bacterium]|nr:4-hydroxy-tetrahydrodipicolinate reductase [Bacillota bacterium]
MTNIIVAGPRGQMGQEALRMIARENHFKLVACIDRKYDGKSVANIPSLPKIDAPIFTDAKTCLEQVDAHILLDLTIPDVGYKHTKLALQNKIRPVVGTTGFTAEHINELTTLAKQQKTGAIIAPNFAIGAILMMKFSQMAAKYFPDVEIIEKHHDQKIDAPSGTAIKTAEMINEQRTPKIQGHPSAYETIKHARGADIEGLKIHSMRLPGLVAHQEVIFGSEGQTLSIKHDSLNRQSFMPGIKLAIEQVIELDELIYGLENIPYFRN